MDNVGVAQGRLWSELVMASNVRHLMCGARYEDGFYAVGFWYSSTIFYDGGCLDEKRNYNMVVRGL